MRVEPLSSSLCSLLPLPCHTHRCPLGYRPPLTPPIHLSLPAAIALKNITLRCSSSSASMHVATSSSEPQLEGSLMDCRAFWVSETIIAWNVDVAAGSCYLYASKAAGLLPSGDRVQGYDVRVRLEQESGQLPQQVVKKFPHIQDYSPFKVPPDVDARVLVKCQLAVGCFNSDGVLIDFTGLQLPGVLDELFCYDGPLGPKISEESVSLYLWAPTAQTVRACIYKNPRDENPMETVLLKEDSNVWGIEGPKSWEGCYYFYEVSVYHPSTSRIETCYASDPYSRGLSSDGSKTLILNMDSDNLKPEGWDNLPDEKPSLRSFSDISIYELHVRDFSANDDTVSADLRGGYLAFTLKDSAGMKHLKKISDAGITHLHLLPTYQFGGVDDERENWKFVDTSKLEKLAADSDEQQAHITAIKDDDGYNWGYNPILWGVPKGSYASEPNGMSRVLEFRKMVQAINHIGLRVVLDVVYNHLYANGPHDKNSVLDKIVPGYYLRLNSAGYIENSTCVNNTATEHYMAERLMLDDLLNWAINYKIDGFRFDLMGFIMKRTMIKAKDALCSLKKEIHGVDGLWIYLYGEGWDFGEVFNNARGVNASQFNLPGTSIGSFNDRIRDAIRGGSPFSTPLEQGFVNGLFVQPNDHDYGSKSIQKQMLHTATDIIQVGIAANLRDFVFINHEGVEVMGSDTLKGDGVPVAYASSPVETINYASAHDNETLFDIINLKAPMELSMEERVGMNNLATNIIALSQGIPFFHAGDEILRSKSLDRDSYNSGDWFNRLDFSYGSNNWGVGLPPKDKNESNWPLIKPRLANPFLKPQRSHIISAMENFLNILRIRYSSLLFRLRNGDDILERVRFHNSGPSALPAVIAFSVEDSIPGLPEIDPIFSCVVVIFNARPAEISLAIPSFEGRTLELHPVQVPSNDEKVKKTFSASSGRFSVPARSTSVFVERRES